MSDQQRYRLVNGTHARREGAEFRHYRKGDDIDLTDAQAKSLGKRVRYLGPIVVRTAAETLTEESTETLSVQTDDGPVDIPLSESADKITAPATTRTRARRGS